MGINSSNITFDILGQDALVVTSAVNPDMKVTVPSVLVDQQYPDGAKEIVAKATNDYRQENPKSALNTYEFNNTIVSALLCARDEREIKNIGTLVVGPDGIMTSQTPIGTTKTQLEQNASANYLLDLAKTTASYPPQTASLKVSNASDGSSKYTKQTFTGDVVNPYKEVWKSGNADNNSILQNTIGGADLVCFYISEVPSIADLMNDVPEAAQQKELIMFEMDNVMSISYSTIRERYPVRQLGQSNPVKYTSGLRTIAGSIAFAIFTEDILGRLRSRITRELETISSKFDNFQPQTQSSSQDWTRKRERFAYESDAYQRSDIFRKIQGMYEVQLLDSLAPFHILVMGCNERGIFSKFMLKNVQIIDENQYQGMAMPNITNKVSYVASDILPMVRYNGNEKFVSISSLNSITESFVNGTFSGTPSFNKELTATEVMNSVKQDVRR
jgi:hypothetical protein